jgi:hypothetical protein
MDPLANIVKAIGEAFRRVWDLWQKMYPAAPRKTVRLIPRSRRHWWHLGSVRKKPAMQLVSYWHATNITTAPVYLLGVRLKHPGTEGGVLVQHPENNIFGNYPILPGDTVEVTADFWIQPPVREPDRCQAPRSWHQGTGSSRAMNGVSCAVSSRGVGPWRSFDSRHGREPWARSGFRPMGNARGAP